MLHRKRRIPTPSSHELSSLSSPMQCLPKRFFAAFKLVIVKVTDWEAHHTAWLRDVRVMVSDYSFYIKSVFERAKLIEAYDMSAASFDQGSEAGGITCLRMTLIYTLAWRLLRAAFPKRSIHHDPELHRRPTIPTLSTTTIKFTEPLALAGKISLHAKPIYGLWYTQQSDTFWLSYGR